MEELVGPDVEVILTLREATDLGFLSDPFFVVATLFENSMETDVHEPDAIVKLDTDMVWESTKANVKKMRNNNVPIKINFYKYLGENRKEKFGYVILNLRSAQYIPKNKTVQTLEDHVKILGLGKEAKGTCPLLLKSLRIRDKTEEASNEFPFEKKAAKTSETDAEADELIDRNELCKLDALDKRDGENIFNDRETLAEAAGKIENRNRRKPSTPNPSPRTRHSLASSSVKNGPTMIGEYESCNSSGDSRTGTKCVQAYHDYKLEIRLRHVFWSKVPPKFRFRFHHSRSEILSTNHPEISLEKPGETVELRDVEAVFNFVETPAEFRKLLAALPPAVSACSESESGPANVARGILDTANLSYSEEETFHEIELADSKSHATIGKLSYVARLVDRGPQLTKDVVLRVQSNRKAEPSEFPPSIFDDATEKIVDELEDWKERQKDRFRHEFAMKLQKEMTQLKAEWTERRKELEEKVNERMEQCKRLGNSLMEATEDVKRKNKELVDKERALEAGKADVESRYLKLLKDKEDETEALETKFQDKIRAGERRILLLEKEKEDLEKRVKELEAEKFCLLTELNRTKTELEKIKKTYLSQDQTANLLQDLKTMQEKLETANNSKLFFKEQWGRAVREIHRIKSEHAKNIQVQLRYRKDELKRLGLEQIFYSEKNKNNLERDDILEAKDFFPSDFPEPKSAVSEMDFPYKAFNTNMDIVKENNNYLLKFNRESEEKLKKLIQERDRLLCDSTYKMDDENILKLNKEIRNLLDR